MIRFSDGITVDTSGPLRALQLRDGLYVVGKGMMIPVRDDKEVAELLRAENERLASALRAAEVEE